MLWMFVLCVHVLAVVGLILVISSARRAKRREREMMEDDPTPIFTPAAPFREGQTRGNHNQPPREPRPPHVPRPHKAARPSPHRVAEERPTSSSGDTLSLASSAFVYNSFSSSSSDNSSSSSSDQSNSASSGSSDCGGGSSDFGGGGSGGDW